LPYYADVPACPIKLSNSITVVVEVGGFEDEEDWAKRQAAHRWVSAVNNWGQMGRWAFHVCRDPQMLGPGRLSFV